MVRAELHPPPNQHRSRQSWLPPLLVAVAAFAAYANSFSGPFFFDDGPAIVDNPTIRNLADLNAVLHPPGDGSGVSGRPLLNLSFALNHALGGLDPAGYHAVNLLIHILAAWCLLGLLRITFGGARFCDAVRAAATPLATAAALLWAVHPLLTESVTFIVQRSESLAGLCFLATVYFFARATANGGNAKRKLSVSVLACACGMAAKETMVVAPLLVLLYDREFASGSFSAAFARRRAYYGALATTWGILVLLVAAGGGTRGAGAGLGLGVSPWHYALTQCEAIVRYLRLALWPHPLVVDYGSGVVQGVAAVWPQALLLVLLLGLTAFLVWRNRPLGFAGAWFFLILAPSSSFIPLVGQTAAEHRMYLPLAAIVVVGVLGLHRLLGRGALALIGALAVVAVIATAARNRDYRDATTLWRDTVAKFPENHRAHFNLGVQLGVVPATENEAIAEYRQAIALQPGYADAHDNLAVLLARRPGGQAEADRHFAEALRLQPESADFHYNFAVAISGRPGRAAEAIFHYRTALRFKPDYPEAHNNLAVALAALGGHAAEAISHFSEAVRERPDYADAHYGLANALAAFPDRFGEALGHYETAIRLKPDFPDSHLAYAGVLERLPGRRADAIREYETCLRLQPNQAIAHFDLANLLASDPATLAGAIRHYEAAVRLLPELPGVRNNLAGAYLRSGRIDDAIGQLTLELQAHPDDRNARHNLEMLRQQRPK